MAGAPLANAPAADVPLADAPLARVPPARVPPEPVAPPAVPAPSTIAAPSTVPAPSTVAAPSAVPAASAAPVQADDQAQLAGTWPGDMSAGTDPYASPVPAVDALTYPAESGAQAMPVPPGFYDPADPAPPVGAPASDAGGRAARRQRVPTREIFCELADLASIPRAAYALETETDGAMCLLPTPDGYEVFIAADGARHEARTFAEEEAAYFYMFGVLVAEAIRSGSLAPTVAVADPHSGMA